MLAFLLAVFTYLMAIAHAVSSNVETPTLTLPQCGNLTLSWSAGIAPYETVITDLTTGVSESFRSKNHHLKWTINLPAYTKISFVVTDASNTTSGGGPYEIVYSGETSCLCTDLAKRHSEELPTVDEISLPKRVDIDLSAVSAREASNLVGERGSSWSIKHAMRSHRRASASHGRLAAAACPK